MPSGDSTRPSMGKRIMHDGDEQDAFTGWRKVLCYLQRAGAVKTIKRQAHKRERREAEQEIRRQLDDN